MTDIDKLKELADAATPGPWAHVTYLSGTQNVEFPGSRGVCDVSSVVDADGSDVAFSWQSLPPKHIDIAHRAEDKGNEVDPRRHANGQFIAMCREAVPSLIAEVERLRDALQLLLDHPNALSAQEESRAALEGKP